MDIYHITPQGKTIICKRGAACSYRKQDHFTSKALAQKVTQIRKSQGFRVLALTKSEAKLSPALRKGLVAHARTATTLDDYIGLGEEFYKAATKVTPIEDFISDTYAKTEEIELALNSTYRQLVPCGKPLLGLAGRGSEGLALLLPDRVKTALRKETFHIIAASKKDMLLHGLHRPWQQEKVPTVLMATPSRNLWVREKKTGRVFWWGDKPSFGEFTKAASAVRILTNAGESTLLKDGNLYTTEVNAGTRLPLALPLDGELRTSFFLHQITHHVQHLLALPQDEALERWAKVRKYSSSAQAAVWHGFPVDAAGLSSEELLPVLTEVLFCPTKQEYWKLYTKDEEIHESLYFIAGLWLALGHQRFRSLDKITA